VHHLGFGFHADECAPGFLELLLPIPEPSDLAPSSPSTSATSTMQRLDGIWPPLAG